METYIYSPERIKQVISDMRYRPPMNFYGLKCQRCESGLVFCEDGNLQPMDIDALDDTGGGFDVYEFKVRGKPFFSKGSQGEIITSHTIAHFQRLNGYNGRYIQVYHDTKADEPIAEANSYVHRIYYGVKLEREYRYGECRVSDIRRGDGLFKIDYCFQSPQGGFLLGIYDPDWRELEKAKKFTDMLNCMGLGSVLMVIPKTAPEENGQIRIGNVLMEKAYYKEMLGSSGEFIGNIQAEYWSFFKDEENPEFRRMKSFIFSDKYSTEEKS